MNSSPCRGFTGGFAAEPALKRARHERDGDSEEPPRSSDRFSNLPPDALTLVLKYARPLDDTHQFEFAWSTGKICKTLRAHGILDVLPASPFHLEDFEEYTPLAGNDEEPFDCRAGLMKALVKDSAKCALISDLNISRASIEKRDGKVDNGIVQSLRFLLTRKGVFTNAKGLHINLTPADRESEEISSTTNIPLLTKTLLRQMPRALPTVTDVTFGHCFCPEALMAKKVFENFFASFQLPLQSITLTRNPFLHECHIANILPLVGNSLRKIEINGAENESIKMVVGQDDEYSLFTAMGDNCKRLESLSLCGMHFYSVDQCLRITFDSIPGVKELVLEGNEYHVYDPNVEVNDYISGEEAEFDLAASFQHHGAKLESLRCDFSNDVCASNALKNLIALQRRNLSRSATEGVPDLIKLRTVDIKNLEPSAIVFAIVAGVKEFIMYEPTKLMAAAHIHHIAWLLSRTLSLPVLPHELLFRFCKIGLCYGIKLSDGKVVVATHGSHR